MTAIQNLKSNGLREGLREIRFRKKLEGEIFSVKSTAEY